MTLSETLVEPAFHHVPDFHETLGPEVAELCSMAGYHADPEQRLILDAIFAMDRRGRASAFEVCVVCSRQNLKTGAFKMAALGKAFLLEQRLVVWSAHEFDTAAEAFRDLCVLIESTPEFDSRVKAIHRGAGKESIELAGDRRIKFKARTKGGGRGLTGDTVTLDEAFALQPEHMGALMPTLSAVEDPQLLYGSSAGLATSDVLRDIRDRGRKGSSPRLAYIEWCAPEADCGEPECRHEVGTHGCQLDDEENWRRSNPAMGRRITIEYIRAEREAMSGVPEEFARERLGWWDDPAAADALFGYGRWERLALPDQMRDAPLPTEGLVLGLAVSIDRAWTSIGGATPASAVEDGEPVEYTLLGLVDRAPGTAWAPYRARELQDKYGCQIVVDGRGPAATLIQELEDAGVNLTIASTSDVCDACGQLHDAVVDTKTVRHPSHGDLDRAVAAAKKRPVGDRWAIGRKDSTHDVSPIEAVTLALWGVTNGGLPAIY